MELREARPVTVWVPGELMKRTGNRRRVAAVGQTVRDVIDCLDRDFPGLGFNLRHETGELRPYVNVFLDGEDVRYLGGLDTPVGDGATVHIIHSVAGG